MKGRFEHLLTTAAVVAASLLVVYVLTAPPVMKAIARQRGSLDFPVLYQPMVRIIESNFNGPLLWYFNDVWHSEIELIGEADTPWWVIVAYALAGAAIVAVTGFPFFKQRFRKIPR